MAGKRDKRLDALLDGRPHTLEQGKDFGCHVHLMRNRLHHAASRRGLRLWTDIVGGKITFQAYDRVAIASHMG